MFLVQVVILPCSITGQRQGITLGDGQTFGPEALSYARPWSYSAQCRVDVPYQRKKDYEEWEWQ